MVDEGRVVDVVYMYFGKAFDMIPHGRLMQKIKSYGIRIALERWIQNWVGQRRQRVAVEQYFSDWRSVTSGVPQGSVLGLLLFVVYNIDLKENVGGLISKFADNTKTGGAADSEEDFQRIQQDMDRLGTWMEKWQEEFNLAK
eukprot:g42111.t1